MKLHEYQSKQIFAWYDIPIPKGEIASNPEEAEKIAESLNCKVVVKSQVLVSRRGKIRGIKIANTPQEAYSLAKQVFDLAIKGLTAQKVLVEEAVEVEKEIYIGIMVDRTVHKPVLIAARKGGVEIGRVIRETPHDIIRLPIDPLFGLLDFQARNVAFDLGLQQSLIASFIKITKGLYQTFIDNDALLAEINPLAVTHEKTLIVIDAKMDLDDNALFRHPDLNLKRDLQEENELERQAREANLSYIKLDGDIGCMVNGAGLAMATLDVVKHYGGKPANFLDIGGGANAEKVSTALRIVLANPNVKVVFINIFGGITRCDEVARGILAESRAAKAKIPLVIRLAGTNETEGKTMLSEAGLPSIRSFNKAAKKAVALAMRESLL